MATATRTRSSTARARTSNEKSRSTRAAIGPSEHLPPLGSGKTALMLALSRALRDEYNTAAATDDIFTKYAKTSTKA
ncbi:hypothetical protein ALT_7187 [Aspergillus lentulus]|uniref:Uncharacterized protein n=1 Tax=Aspergillus lentulus TaxID=293939 RepID=A0AAN4PT56_ASPLE|nr:hypothetical protein ALT_7187 [Aspergillus lentulus]